MSQENCVAVDLQYDGVIMLSSEKVLFNDAKPRPDGSQIYHIFEKSNAGADESLSENCLLKFDQLISQAKESNEHDVFQILNRNDYICQEWLPISTAGSILYTKLSDSSYGNIAPLANGTSGVNTLNTENIGLSSNLLQLQIEDPNLRSERISIPIHCHFSPYKLHKFFSKFPHELRRSCGKSKLSKKLKRRGVVQVNFEPENHSLTLKTKKSAMHYLSLLRRFDSDLHLLSTARDLIFCENECGDACPASRYVIANL